MSVELRNRITRICKEKGMSLNTIADRIGNNADLDNILQAMWVDIVGYMDKDRCFDELEEIEHFALED